MTMNVSLTPQLDRFVRTKVESGRYTSASEVVREALRLLERLDTTQEARLAALRADIEQALADDEVDFSFDAVKAEGRARRKSDG